MKLNKETRDAVVFVSLKYIGERWTKEFTCIDFVRDVYRKVGIELPLVWGYSVPQKEFNISKKDFISWTYGYIVFLKRKKYSGKRVWTHLAITLPNGRIIHCSERFGGNVSIVTKEEVLSIYQYIPSE